MRQRYSGTLLPIFFDTTQNPDGAPHYLNDRVGVIVYTTTFYDEQHGPWTPNKIFTMFPLSASATWNQINDTILSQFKGRYNGNCVLLADGTVMFVGGDVDSAGDDHHPNLDVDIYDPEFAYGNQSNPWTKGASALKRRSYHSVASLMSDGRVLLTGTEPDTSYEIYTPDYLFRGPRPVFSVTPDAVGYDQFLYIRLGNGWTFGQLRKDRCGLVRMGAVTHGWGFDQRYINLYACHISNESPFPGGRYPEPDSSDTQFRLHIPQNPNLVPPGYYMLFLVSALENALFILYSGAPSLGHIIQIGG